MAISTGAFAAEPRAAAGKAAGATAAGARAGGAAAGLDAEATGAAEGRAAAEATTGGGAAGARGLPPGMGVPQTTQNRELSWLPSPHCWHSRIDKQQTRQGALAGSL